MPLGEEAGFSGAENLFELGAGLADLAITGKRHLGMKVVVGTCWKLVVQNDLAS